MMLRLRRVPTKNGGEAWVDPGDVKRVVSTVCYPVQIQFRDGTHLESYHHADELVAILMGEDETATALSDLKAQQDGLLRSIADLRKKQAAEQKKLDDTKLEIDRLALAGLSIVHGGGALSVAPASGLALVDDTLILPPPSLPSPQTGLTLRSAVNASFTMVMAVFGSIGLMLALAGVFS